MGGLTGNSEIINIKDLLDALQRSENLRFDKNLLLSNLGSYLVSSFTIDSRNIEKNSVFIALQGKNSDGHLFIENAINEGASYVIAKKTFIENNKGLYKKFQSHLIIVDDPEKSLVAIAKYRRENSKATFIGITGSVGKTSTKEMLAMVLQDQAKTFATKGNFNNHLGLPLSLANMDNDCRFVVLEMGMNHKGEISFLTHIAKPEIAIITNIFNNHIENFNSEAEICEAKAEIFEGFAKDTKNLAIINNDNLHYKKLYENAKKFNPAILSFGKKDGSDIRLIECKYDAGNISATENPLTYVSYLYNGKESSYKLHSINEGIILNSLIVFLVIHYLNLDVELAVKSIEKFSPLKGRGNIHKNILFNKKNISIIDDSYNSGYESLKVALKNLDNMTHLDNRKIAIIGDILELGVHSEKTHKDIARFIDEETRIDRILLVGNHSKYIYEELQKIKSNRYKQNQYFRNVDDLVKVIDGIIDNDDLILIKASRGVKLDLLVKYLLETN